LAARRLHPFGERPRPDLPLGHHLLPQIRHVVVVMMENHSFDQHLGTLGRGDGLPVDEHGVPTSTNPKADGTPVRSHRAATTFQQDGVPTQSWEAVHEQWAGGDLDGFVRSAAAAVPGADGAVAMARYGPEDLPFYASLARTFPVADRWFSSLLGPTFPNRRYLVAGTSNGLVTDKLSATFDRPPAGTVFDLLEAAGLAWGDYHPVPHRPHLAKRVLGVHGLRAGRALRHQVEGRRGRARRAEDEAKSVLRFTADAYPLGLAKYVRHVHPLDRFLEDAAAGTLPAFSLVDPDFEVDSEENPQDVRLGEAFAGRAIRAVLEGPGWPATVLVWCYDEHGGYYDHVPPPAAVEPDDVPPRGGGPWRFDRYGFRVPAVVASPFARPGHVSSVVRDHTSVLGLLGAIWNLPPLTRRVAAADDLLDCLDLEAPPAFLDPPALAAPALGWDGAPDAAD
jgi:phospholipase C